MILSEREQKNNLKKRERTSYRKRMWVCIKKRYYKRKRKRKWVC